VIFATKPIATTPTAHRIAAVNNPRTDLIMGFPLDLTAKAVISQVAGYKERNQ
jgi:hypothetical protein